MPGFTALNGGGSPKTLSKDTAGTIEVRMQPLTNDEREHSVNGVSPLTIEPKTIPETSISSRREREIWGTTPLHQPPFRSSAAPYPNLENIVEAAQKRKRSPSTEDLPRAHQYVQHKQQHEEVGVPRVLSTAETAAAAIAAASAAATVALQTRESEHPRASVEPRDPYDPPRKRPYDSRPLEESKRDQQRQREREQRRVDIWYSLPSREDRHSAGAGSIQSPADEQSGNDSRQREKSTAHATSSPQSEYAGHTPDEEDQLSSFGGAFSPTQPRKESTSIPQSDPKRRKRNFSNRTKTGCLTCRKRKKKCDETKPECSNCVRGGFICAGYPPQKGQWGKIDLTKPTVQIESKDPSYVPPGAYGMPGTIKGPQASNFLQQRRDTLPPYRGQALRIEPPQGRPLQTDDDRPTASTLPSAMTSSDGHNKLSALSTYSAPANVFPTPISAATTVPFLDRTPKEYQRVPPLHDLSRTTEPDTPQHTSPLPQINIQRSGSPRHEQRSPPQQQLQQQTQQAQRSPQHSQSQQRQQPQPEQSTLQPHQPQQLHQQHQQDTQQSLHHRPQPHHQPYHQSLQQQRTQQSQPQQSPHPQHQPEHHQRQELSPTEVQRHFPPLRTYSPPAVSQQQQLPPPPIALSGDAGETRTRRSRTTPFFNTMPGSRRERNEMYAGRPFFQFDKELVAERERCGAACWKFNNSMNPNVGVSLSERTRLFKEILQPRDNLQTSPIAHVGSVGEQVIVEAPFHADYGYNITIGEDVYIGRNCHISDAMPISIGNRVYIGPNVSFYTTTLPTDHTQREGVHSAIHGRGITIGDDVFIGGNVTILAGVNIGHGTTVGAGSVVSRVK
ncbi:nodulation protein l [Niveomyces insectorum RCEF 264]|uniref:Nodulation protein l n=1 Tax=Niveomyces insectorum RCEF 264 TaxID=1081102 RepID=A0A167LLZ2_9HYPO|nr:nodulation protein l [Niveomyces insectorum RCEF 264]